MRKILNVFLSKMKEQKRINDYKKFKIEELRRIKCLLPDDKYKTLRSVIVIGGIHGVESSSSIENIDKTFDNCFNELYCFKLLY